MQGPTPAERPALTALTEQHEKALRRALQTQRNKVFAIHAIGGVQAQVDALAAQARQRSPVECVPGCDACCHLRVEAMAPEVFALARALRQRPAADLQALRARLQAHAAQARGLSSAGHAAARLPCPLLQGGRCGAYALRPFMCRKLQSASAKACAAGDPVEDRRLFLEAAAVTYGAHLGYGRAKLPNGVHELGQALARALDDPGAEDRWFRGDPVFDPLPEQAGA